MGEAEVSRFLCILIKMGEALQNSGAEVFRVEDTLNRIAAAYGAQEVNVFVITSSIVVTLTMPQLHADKILIGIIMLLIPGIMLTNSIRDILLGDIISGSLRLVEAILMAAVLALGMMAAIWLMGGIA